ncbi:MAG: phosphoserine phosphatase RsbU/P [Clostridiales bacterium]|nr:phosphoserine phosphatase RsbU/P [Clostridiales bacterium]
MKIRSLRLKSVIAALLFSALLSCISITISYKIYSNTIDKHYEQNAWNIAKAAASQMNGDKIQEYITKVEGLDPNNKDYQKQLQQIKDDEYYNMLDILFDLKESHNTLYLYVEKVAKDKVTYILDADVEGSACELGETRPLAKKNLAYLNSLDKGLPPFITNSSDFGWLVTAGAPIFDSNGTVVALASVDISMDTIMRDRHSFLTFILITMVSAAIIATALLIYYINRQVVRPINALSKAASQFVSDADKQKQKMGEESAISLLEIHTGDEIEHLFDAIKTMEKDIGNYINNLTAITAEKERIAAELDVATQIQASMLPCIFPAFPEHKEFDIYATMQPAKEVGGDFYDFFLIDDDHLAVVIADVSGKGVPAALFMVITKTLIKNQAQSGISPSQVFTLVNEQLCENNEAGMFVTAWMGVLEISTGHMEYVNAGHNPPLVKKNTKEVEFIKSRAGFVLAGMEGIAYRQNEMMLEPGDCLFLYTDGVTEATNQESEFYGENRLKERIKHCKEGEPVKLLSAIKNDMDIFVLDAAQFDDITMLALMIRGGEQ